MENQDEAAVISVLWNEESQGVVIHFDPKQFRSWQFVKACLQMAVDDAEASIRRINIEQMRRQATEAMIGQKIHQQIIGGH